MVTRSGRSDSLRPPPDMTNVRVLPVARLLAVVFQILTLGQPSVPVTVALVVAVVVLLWARLPSSRHLELPAMPRTSGL